LKIEAKLLSWLFAVDEAQTGWRDYRRDLEIRMDQAKKQDLGVEF